MKGLIIDEPWIGFILRGEKTWEMRKKICNFRGTFALIRKGSGSVVGVAQLLNSLPPLTSQEAYSAAEQYHCIPTDRQKQAFEDGWRTPWVLAAAKPLPCPISYSHPSGAVIWVNLDPKVTAEIEKQLSSEQESPILPPAAAAVSRPTIMARVKRHQPPGDSIPASSVGLVSHGLRTTVYVPLTGGNIRNSHIHLSSVIQFFPEDAIGGRNKTEVATKTIRVTFSPGSTIDTDIDGTKKLLRARGAITDFFARSGAMEGDMVRIYRTAPYEFDFSINLPT